MEVRGQYFDDKGWPLLGGAVRLNIGDGANNTARLSPANQHTLAYGANRQVAVAWMEGNPVSGIVATLRPVPASFLPGCQFCQQNPQLCLPCLKGDMNGDCLFNGLDIQKFTLAVADANCLSVAELCSADMNGDFTVDFADVPCFVAQVLVGSHVACGGNLGSFGDCNANAIPDANDIADGTSQDCNNNFIPDECDLDETDPDGNELVSADVNGNSVPDECEPDCNQNSIPDAWDISQQTSTDVNANAIPDDCEADCNNNDVPDSYEIAQQTVPDCNANSVPDGCEADCNANGKPDDCDIDPTDPDGNGQTSPDCNANGVPDSCDLSLPPPFGSVDCNSNGIPDECDIANEVCEDENTNGICDICEGGSMEGRTGPSEPTPRGTAPTADSFGKGPADDGNTAGGGCATSDTAEGGCATDTGGDAGATDTAGGGCATSTAARGGTPAEEAAWEAYYEWSMQQAWGPDSPRTGEEQFLRIQEKALELGLEVADIVRR